MSELLDQIYQAEIKFTQAQEELARLRALVSPEVVDDYAFPILGGRTLGLSELFGGGQDLILVHNMGRKCPSCTMWADEYNGVLQHLESRAAFVVSSPDLPEVQAEFAKERGWNFQMVSVDGTNFAHDMGFHTTEGSCPGYQPGVSTFRKHDDGSITRIGQAFYGPGDVFSSVWHYFGMLQDGVGDWDCKFKY